jgi:hypothetical protein
MSKNIMTPNFVASYPKLFKAELNEQSGKMEYSVVALFKKGEDLTALKKAAEEVIVAKFGADKSKWPKNLKSPFRDQAEREKEGKLPAGHESGAFFMTLKSQYKPGVVDSEVQPIIVDGDVYAGCIMRATVRPYYYEKNGNKGVAFGLQNAQKVSDGTPIGGAKVSASDEFAPVAGKTEKTEESMWG